MLNPEHGHLSRHDSESKLVIQAGIIGAAATDVTGVLLFNQQLEVFRLGLDFTVIPVVTYTVIRLAHWGRNSNWKNHFRRPFRY